MKINNYNRKYFFISILILLILVCISILYIRYIKNVYLMDTTNYVKSISENQEISFENILNLKIKTLETIGNTDIINDPTYNILTKTKLLATEESKYKHVNISISDLHGNAYTTNNENYNISNMKFFKEILAGKTFSTEYIQELKTYILITAIPLKYNDELVGVLFFTEEINFLNYLYEHSFYIKGVNQYIITDTGTIVETTEDSNLSIGDNYFDIIRVNNLPTKFMDMENKLNYKKDYIDILKYNDDKFYVSISPFSSIDGMFSVISIRKDYIMGFDNKIINASIFLLISFICIISFSIIALIRYNYYYNYLKEEHEMKKLFLSNISHEIRSPMNGIIGSTELALLNKDNPEKIEYFLDKAMIASNKLLGLLNDLLSMSKSESNEIELMESEVSFKDIIKVINAIIKPMIMKKELNYTIEISSVNNLKVICDKGKIEQILVNLLTNAIKYTNKNGDIKFSIQLSKKHYNNIGKFIFTVEDTGIGMSKEFMDRIFVPFVQQDNSNSRAEGGAGLGLPITKSLIDLMNGKIEVISKVNVGTKIEVSLDLPIIDELDENSEDDSSHESVNKAAKFNGKKLLLAEDDEINRIVQSEIFKNLGFIVETAENGEQAFNMFLNSPDSYFDIIIMDIQMPIIDGYKASNYIRSSNHKDSKNITILGMTASTIVEDIELAKKSGMDDCLSKPIEMEKLIHTLEKIFFN